MSLKNQDFNNFMPDSIKSFLKEWGLLILLTFFVSSCRSFFAEPRYIPSGSITFVGGIIYFIR